MIAEQNLKTELQLFMRLEKGDRVVLIDNNQVHYYGIINDNPPKKTPWRYPFITYLTREVKWINKPEWSKQVEKVGTCSIKYVSE
ncbi:MAG TPA: hypothetical protein VFC68_03200 [Treponemataceae bacterium]|nr:hypothetical protein [Treponemataceae bacterium]